jgi:hypothetical protein
MPPRPDQAALRQQMMSLRAGVVLHLYQPLAGKEKFHVLIAALGDRSLGFLINSRPSPFIERQADRLRRQLLMSKDLHPFLQHDSYVACDDTVKLPCARDLAEGLCVDRIQRVGIIHVSLHGPIRAAAEGSRLIATRDAELIARAFPR